MWNISRFAEKLNWITGFISYIMLTIYERHGFNEVFAKTERGDKS